MLERRMLGAARVAVNPSNAMQARERPLSQKESQAKQAPQGAENQSLGEVESLVCDHLASVAPVALKQSLTLPHAPSLNLALHAPSSAKMLEVLRQALSNQRTSGWVMEIPYLLTTKISHASIFDPPSSIQYLLANKSPQTPLPTMQSLPSTHTAFFYGTLMHPPILQRVIQNPSITLPSSNITTSPALLPGYTRHRVRHADYPAIIPPPPVSSSSSSNPSANDNGGGSEQPCVRGTLVQGLTRADIHRLDIFEGDEYERRVVSVTLLPSHSASQKADTALRIVEVETYVWIAGEEGLEDREWDFDEFRREKLGRWLGSESREYEDLEMEGEGEGDPTRGRRPNGSIGRALEGGRGGGGKGGWGCSVRRRG
ncbi:MAG: hypothetical protein M1820_009917 [Bogoriella megaspora]|nr:MAG: hypothetical protein M1820_009917 [Bogoriella megaspora]